MLLWVQSEQKGLKIRILRLNGLAGEFLMLFVFYEAVIVELKIYLLSNAEIDRL